MLSNLTKTSWGWFPSISSLFSPTAPLQKVAADSGSAPADTSDPADALPIPTQSMQDVIRRVASGDGRVVVIRGVGDGFFYAGATKVIEGGLNRAEFPEADTLVAIEWDKNAVYYNLNRGVFPKLATIVLILSHPCDYSVPRRFPEAKWHTWSGFGRYFEGVDYTPVPNEDMSRLYTVSERVGYWIAKRTGRDKVFFLSRHPGLPPKD